MEELKLEDLTFESGNDQIFDVFKENKENTNTSKEEDKTNTPNSEENKSPESVAKKEEDKTNQVDEIPNKGNEGNSNSSSPKLNDTEKLYSSLANEFKAKGILSSLDKDAKITSMEDIYNALQKEIESKLTEKQKAINEAIKVGVPADDVSRQLDSIEKLKNIPESHIVKENNVEFRRNVIAQDFINKGFNKEKAIVMAQRSIDSGDDIDDAINALKEIISHEQSILDNTINSKKEEETEALTKVRAFIDKDEEIIPGFKLTTSQKQELYDQVTNDLGDKENAFIKAQKEDPLGSRMKLEALFYLTKGLKDFSVFSNKAQSKVSNDIENLLRGASFTEDGRINTNTVDNQSTFSLKDLEGVTFE